MRKKVLRGIFVAVVLLTVLFVAYIITVPAEPVDDIFGNSMDGGIFLLILSPILLAEFNIYRFFVYFLTEKKAYWKTIFNIVMIIATLFLSLAVLNDFFGFFGSFFGIWIEFKYRQLLWLIVGFILVVIRFIYYLCCAFKSRIYL